MQDSLYEGQTEGNECADSPDQLRVTNIVDPKLSATEQLQSENNFSANFINI